MRLYNAYEVEKAVDDGLDVRCDNDSYQVIKDNLNRYLIYNDTNNYCTGLTWHNGYTLNGNIFYVKERKMRKLYIDGKLLLTIEDVDNIIEDEAGDEFKIKDYIAFLVDSNIRYEGVNNDYDFKWEESNE